MLLGGQCGLDAQIQQNDRINGTVHEVSLSVIAGKAPLYLYKTWACVRHQNTLWIELTATETMSLVTAVGQQ